MPKHAFEQQSRRRLLKAITATGSLFLGSKFLPDKWTKPVVDSVVLPAHAGMSPPYEMTEPNEP